MPSSSPLRTIARPSGCSENFSAAVASSSRAFWSQPLSVITSCTSGSPSERVPVLSMATASTSPATSSLAPPLIRMPRRAALATPATMAVGVAITRAQGHATMSTVTAAIEFPVTRKTTIARPRMIGLK